MLILGIDTSTKLCSVALYDTEKGVLGEINIVVAKNHSNLILPIIDELLQGNEKKIEEVDRIAVGVGPGSFTGIRVGMAIAKGLAIGKKKEIVGVSGLEALAFSCPNEGRIFSLIDARKGRVYYQIFDQQKAIIEAKDGELKDVLKQYQGEKDNYFVGDGALAYQEMIKEYFPEGIIVPEEQGMMRAIYFAKLSSKKPADNLYTLEPMYVCKSQAEKSKEKV